MRTDGRQLPHFTIFGLVDGNRLGQFRVQHAAMTGREILDVGNVRL